MKLNQKTKDLNIQTYIGISIDIQVIVINIIYSGHALEKMDALGIERKEVESVLQKGMKWQKEGKWFANMYGIEVVFKKQENILFIITVYLGGIEK